MNRRDVPENLSRFAASDPGLRPALAAILLPTLLVTLIGCSSSSDDLATTSELSLRATDGESIEPFASDRVKVFVFLRIDCPISNRYAPELQRLYDKERSQPVDWWAVYPNPQITPAEIESHQAEYAIPCRALLDPDHELADQTQAAITPEAVVYDGDNQLIYCGRIDDRYADLGQARRSPTQHDLDDAIESALLREKMVPVRRKAVGCYIKDLK